MIFAKNCIIHILRTLFRNPLVLAKGLKKFQFLLNHCGFFGFNKQQLPLLSLLVLATRSCSRSKRIRSHHSSHNIIDILARNQSGINLVKRIFKVGFGLENVTLHLLGLFFAQSHQWKSWLVKIEGQLKPITNITTFLKYQGPYDSNLSKKAVLRGSNIPVRIITLKFRMMKIHWRISCETLCVLEITFFFT